MPSSAARVCIDWLRFTAQWHSPALPKSLLQASHPRICNKVFPFAQGWIECRALFGHTVGYQNSAYPTVTVHWSPSRIDMGVMIDMPGSAMRDLANEDVVGFYALQGFRCSRIDLALDFESRAPFEELHDEFEDGKVLCKARRARLIKEAEGRTVYVGSRHSEKFLRIYDKSAEQQTNELWTRVELECKGEFARGVARHVAQDGLASTPAIIRAFCDWNQNQWWLRHMTSPTLSPAIPKEEKHTNTFKWLMETVAPAIVRFSRENPDFYSTYINRLVALGWFSDAPSDKDPFDGKADFDIKS
jgi:hypothetical protein